MRNYLLKIWQWLKSKFQKECEPVTRAERRAEMRRTGKDYRVFKMHRYSGMRRYTPAPSIHLSYDWPFNSI